MAKSRAAEPATVAATIASVKPVVVALVNNLLPSKSDELSEPTTQKAKRKNSTVRIIQGVGNRSHLPETIQSATEKKLIICLVVTFYIVLTCQNSAADQQKHGQNSTAFTNTESVEPSMDIDPNVLKEIPRQALKRAYKLLDQRNIESRAKKTELEEWAHKYKDLKQQLKSGDQARKLLRQARQLLEQGKLEKVGELLDKLLIAKEQEVDCRASLHFNRARVFDLLFLPHQALSHYAKAYQYRPDDLDYALAYAHILQEKKQYSDAIPVYEKILTTYRALAKSDMAGLLPAVATTLNHLGVLFSATQRLSEAETNFREALSIYRVLAKSYIVGYQPEIAMILNNLGNLYSDSQRFQEAEASYHEALAAYRALAKTHAAVYQSYIAGTLTNLGVLYKDTQRLQEAETSYHEALAIYRALAKSDTVTYQPETAMTLNNLAVLLLQQQEVTQAQAYIEEVVKIRRMLWTKDSATQGDDLARVLVTKALLLESTAEKITQRCEALTEATQVAISERMKQVAKHEFDEICNQRMEEVK